MQTLCRINLIMHEVAISAWLILMQVPPLFKILTNTPTNVISVKYQKMVDRVSVDFDTLSCPRIRQYCDKNNEAPFSVV